MAQRAVFVITPEQPDAPPAPALPATAAAWSRHWGSSLVVASSLPAEEIARFLPRGDNGEAAFRVVRAGSEQAWQGLAG